MSGSIWAKCWILFAPFLVFPHDTGQEAFWLGPSAFEGHLFAVFVTGDLVDRIARYDLFPVFGIGRGDLECVEQDAGAFAVQLAGGEGLDDFVEGELDGAAVFKIGEGKCGVGFGSALLNTRVEVENSVRAVRASRTCRRMS